MPNTDSGQILACGLGVPENGYFGFFDLVTGPNGETKGTGRGSCSHS